MSSLDYFPRSPQNAWHMVSEQQYLGDILVREAVGTGLSSPALVVPGLIRPVIQQWANRFLLDVTPSGGKTG